MSRDTWFAQQRRRAIVVAVVSHASFAVAFVSGIVATHGANVLVPVGAGVFVAGCLVNLVILRMVERAYGEKAGPLISSYFPWGGSIGLIAAILRLTARSGDSAERAGSGPAGAR